VNAPAGCGEVQGVRTGTEVTLGCSVRGRRPARALDEEVHEAAGCPAKGKAQGAVPGANLGAEGLMAAR